MDEPSTEAELRAAGLLGRSPEEHWRDNEIAREDRLRQAAKMPLGVNLAAALELSALAAELRDGLRRHLASKSS